MDLIETQNIVTPAEPVATDKAKPKKAWSRRRKIALTVILLFLAYIFLVLGMVWHYAYAVRDDLRQAKNSFSRAELAISQLYLDQAENDLHKIDAYLKGVKFSEYLPFIGPQVAEANRMFDDSQQIFSDLKQMADTLLQSSVVNKNTLDLAQLSPAEKTVWFSDLRTIQNQIQSLVPKIEATILVNQVKHESEMKTLQDYQLALNERLEELRRILTIADLSIDIYTDLAGQETEKRLLLVNLQPNELRPVGYFSAYTLLSTKDGKINYTEFNDSYYLDDLSGCSSLPAPQPINRYDSDQPANWCFRDAGWSPDFPTVVPTALQILQAERQIVYGSDNAGRSGLTDIKIDPARKEHFATEDPNNIQAVIGFTPDFATDLMQFTGGEMQVRKELFSDKETNYYILEKEAYDNYFLKYNLPAIDKKDLIFEWGYQLLHDTLLKLDNPEWPQIFLTMWDNLESKHLVFYSMNPVIERKISRLNWGGQQASLDATPDTDYLFLADANLGHFNKADLGVKRSLSYTLLCRVDNCKSDFIAHYTNTNRPAQERDPWRIDDIYQTYSRLYTPLGSQIISGPEQAKLYRVTEELNKTAFNSLLQVPLDETREVHFEYQLPKTIVDRLIDTGSYELLIQKQIGTQSYPLQLRLEMPRAIGRIEPAVGNCVDNICDINLELDHDLRIKIELLP